MSDLAPITPRSGHSDPSQNTNAQGRKNWLLGGIIGVGISYGVYRLYLILRDRQGLEMKKEHDPLDANFKKEIARREEALRRVFRVLQPDPASTTVDISVLDWNLLSLSSDPKWARRQDLSGIVSQARFVEVYLGVYDGTSRDLFDRQVKSFQASANAIMETRASRHERLGVIYDNLDTERKGTVSRATVHDVVNRNMGNSAPTQTFYKVRHAVSPSPSSRASLPVLDIMWTLGQTPS